MKQTFCMFKFLLSLLEKKKRPAVLTWGYDIEEIFKFVHPNFCQSSVVLVNDMASATRECIWCCLSENMTDVRASYNLQRASTLPDLEKKAIPCKSQ